MRIRALLLGAGAILCAAGACSVVNKPDDPVPPGTGGGGAVGGSGGSGGTPECADDGDCSDLTDECQHGACTDGSCEAVPEPAGTACGSPDMNECDAPDACDGAGVCDTAQVADGTPCNDCAAGAGFCDRCADGVCGDCATWATSQSFVRDDSIAGWQLSGGWALYHAAPRNFQSLQVVPFGKQVLGTDGNRVAPYPGQELETSTAVSRPSILPATLSFRSWNVDESIDTKRIRVSVDDGVSWTVLADCSQPPLNAFPFCPTVTDRLPDAWDAITIPIPTAMVGMVGIVEFFYNTQDACCDFERGWFIDVLSVATQCACDVEEDCGYVTDTCGTGACDSGSGECQLTPEPVDTTCGDQAIDTECDHADACDGNGYCSPRHKVDGAYCFDCNAGPEACKKCELGVCPDCSQPEPANGFDTPAHLTDWTFNGGFHRYSSAPPSVSFTSPVNFPTGAFGTDGNRVPPYPGNEVENSTARTHPFLVPMQITFTSWHVDEGNIPDYKRISISTDGGMTFTDLANCQQPPPLNAFPFCTNANFDRPAAQVDPIVLDTSAFAGQEGILEFGYTTGDACCQFERGWFIDDLSVARYCSQ